MTGIEVQEHTKEQNNRGAFARVGEDYDTQTKVCARAELRSKCRQGPRPAKPTGTK